MNLEKLEDKMWKRFFAGIGIGVVLAIVALIIFNEISFILGGFSIMIIGISLMYYLMKMKRK